MSKIVVYKRGTLVVKFTRKGSVVTARVVRQGRELRGVGVIAECLIRSRMSRECLICSFSKPEIVWNNLHIRGSLTYRDNEKGVYNYGTPRKAKAIIARWQRMIAAVNEKETGT